MTENKETKDTAFLPKKPKHPWKNVLLILIFIAINAAVIISTAVNEFGNSDNAQNFAEIRINWWMLLPAVLCFAVALIAEIFKYVLMIYRMSDEKKTNEQKKKIVRNSWKVARRTVILGKYYDSITPAAIGGQPFQIYYMRKHSGLTKGEANSIPMFGMVSNQIGFLVIAVFCFIFGNVFKSYPALIVTAWIGLAVYAFWPVMLLGISFFPKPTAKFINFIVRLLAKIRIIKDVKKKKKKMDEEINEYSKSIKIILHERGLFVEIILLSILFNALIASIPFFVLTAFGGELNFFDCLALTVAVTSAVYFVPTPGNSGAAEGTFYLVFSALSSGYVFWAMLFWRFFSYYIYIIMGPITYLSMHFEKKRLENEEAKQ